MYHNHSAIMQPMKGIDFSYPTGSGDNRHSENPTIFAANERHISKAISSLSNSGNPEDYHGAQVLESYLERPEGQVVSIAAELFPDNEFWKFPNALLILPGVDEENIPPRLAFRDDIFFTTQGEFREDTLSLVAAELPRLAVLLQKFEEGGAYTPGNPYIEDLIGVHREAIKARSTFVKSQKRFGVTDEATNYIIQTGREKGTPEEHLVIESMGSLYYTTCSLEDLQDAAQRVLAIPDVREGMRERMGIFNDIRFPTPLSEKLIHLFVIVRDMASPEVYIEGVKQQLPAVAKDLLQAEKGRNFEVTLNYL